MQDSRRYREAAKEGDRWAAFSIFCECYFKSRVNDFATDSRKCPVVLLAYDGANLRGLVGEYNGDRDEITSKDEFDVELHKVELHDGKWFRHYFSFHTTADDVVSSERTLCGLLLDKHLKRVFLARSFPFEVIVIQDSCTGFMPVWDPQGFHSGGDERTIKYRVMPSIMKMSVKSTCQPVALRITRDSADVLVVGDPDVPTFCYKGKDWSLGKLPHSADEVKWVAHLLRTVPLLDKHATKAVVLKRMKKAKLIHLATHGSSVSGFLAFAPSPDDSTVLMYPEEVEQLKLPQAELVVLSCCDCAGDMDMKKDDRMAGMVGMARAFIRAGAQAVLTILWRTWSIDDKRASLAFMQFFYQFLADGLKSSVALQKAINGLMCFEKYSWYCYWSCYHFIGREIVLEIDSETKMLEERLGKYPVFPLMEIVEKLEDAFLKNPETPHSVVQVLQGGSGMKPTRTAVAFIYQFHKRFTGGIFWINGSNEELLNASLMSVEKTLCGRGPSLTEPTLVVLRVLSSPPKLNRFEMLNDFWHNLNTHIIVVSSSLANLNFRPREKNIIPFAHMTLLQTQSIQRFAYEVLRNSDDFSPTSEDQDIFCELNEFTNGSATLTSIAAPLLAQSKPLEFANKISLQNIDPQTKAIRRYISFEDVSELPKNEKYDAYTSLCQLVKVVGLGQAEVLLFCLSLFPCSPIPERVLQQMLNLLTDSEEKARKWKEQLIRCKLLYKYPQAVIVPPRSFSSSHEGLFKMGMYCVSYIVSTALEAKEMKDIDKAAALSVAYKALERLSNNIHESDSRLLVHYLCGFTSLLLLKADEYAKRKIITEDCYEVIRKLHEKLC